MMELPPEANEQHEGSGSAPAPAFSYLNEPSEDVLEMLNPIPGGQREGVELDALSIEDESRQEYNQVKRDISKLRSRDINFDGCLAASRHILSAKSKDLRVATWYCVSALWSESANDTERLGLFRDGLVLLKELLQQYGSSLYPLDQELQRGVVESFFNNSRLARLRKIELQQKREVFKITDHSIERLLEANIPIQIRNDVRELLNKEFEGRDQFLKYVNQHAFERYEPTEEQLGDLKKEGRIDEAQKQAAVEYYRALILDYSRQPIEYPAIQFRISTHTIRHLTRLGIPEEALESVRKHEGVAAIGEDQFEARIKQRLGKGLKDLLEPEEVSHWLRQVVDFSNENRWLVLELYEVTQVLKNTTSAFFGAPISIKLLEECMKELDSEVREFVDTVSEREEERQKGMLAEISYLKERIMDLESKNEQLRNEVSMLKEENKRLKEMGAHEVENEAAKEISPE